jgi:imidazolonepropionase-like amidohydrolase
MSAKLFTNVSIIDGSGNAPFVGDVRVAGNRIAAVARQPGSLPADGAEIVDGAGATLMPGLTDAHAHLSFTNAVDLAGLGEMPPEEQTLWTMKVAKLLLDHGYTSCFSGSAAKPRVDVAIRDAIDRGDIAGPRLRAATKQLTVTGGFGDLRKPHYDLGDGMPSVPLDGPDAFRDYCRAAIRDGVDTIKIVPSAHGSGPDPLAEDTVMTDAEVAAVCEVARQRGRKVAAHARSDGAVRLCLRNGVDMIYHATLAEPETLDMLEAERNRIFVAPALGLQYARLHNADDFGVETPPAVRDRLAREIEIVSGKMADLFRRGVRVMPGGDYGFKWNPHGTNARDIEHMVRLFGVTPMQAIVAATRWGGALMGHQGDLGEVREGCLADLLMIDGDPLQDIAILQDQHRMIAIMKDGAFHKAPPVAAAVPHRQAAE